MNEMNIFYAVAVFLLFVFFTRFCLDRMKPSVRVEKYLKELRDPAGCAKALVYFDYIIKNFSVLQEIDEKISKLNLYCLAFKSLKKAFEEAKESEERLLQLQSSYCLPLSDDGETTSDPLISVRRKVESLREDLRILEEDRLDIVVPPAHGDLRPHMVLSENFSPFHHA